MDWFSFACGALLALMFFLLAAFVLLVSDADYWEDDDAL